MKSTEKEELFSLVRGLGVAKSNLPGILEAIKGSNKGILNSKAPGTGYSLFHVVVTTEPVTLLLREAGDFVDRQWLNTAKGSVIESLVKGGGDINSKDKDGDTALDNVLLFSLEPKVIIPLVINGSNVILKRFDDVLKDKECTKGILQGLKPYITLDLELTKTIDIPIELINIIIGYCYGSVQILYSYLANRSKNILKEDVPSLLMPQEDHTPQKLEEVISIGEQGFEHLE